MTDFHKLFMVKINKMIKKKTGVIFLIAYLICGSLVFPGCLKKMYTKLIKRKLN